MLIAALVVDSIGNGLFLPLSLIFFTQLTDVRLGLLGALISLANALTLPIPIWAGLLVDRFGALPVVVTAQLMQGAGYLGFNWVEGPVGIFLASGLVAVGVRFFWSSVFTAVADFAEGSSWAATTDTWFAWTMMTRTAGLAVGGLVTGLAIADGRTGTYHVVAYAAAGCFVLAAVTIAVFVRTPGRRHETEGLPIGYRDLLRDKPFLTYIGINTVFAMSSMMLALALPTFLLDGLHAPRWLSSLILVANTVVLSLLAAPVVRRLAPHRRTRAIIAAAGCWAIWSFLFAALRPTSLAVLLPVVIVATAFFTLAELFHAPVSMALASALSPAAARGRYLAAFQYTFTIAGLISPVFFTTLFELNRAAPWIGLGLVNLAALAATHRLERTIPSSAQFDHPPVPAALK